MKHFTTFQRYLGILSLFVLLFVGEIHGQTQLPECTDVPLFVIDMSQDPDSTFVTPEIERTGQCCTGIPTNENFISFYVTLHPSVAMVEIDIVDGYANPPGSGFYNVVSGGDLITPGVCGPDIQGGSTVCITGAGPHKFSYHKPGSNLVKYYLRQIPRPIFPVSQPTRVGCTLPLEIYGLDNITINATATTGSASLATCNTFLSCTTCDVPVFTPGTNATYPYTITYEVCGSPQASACGVYDSCQEFTVTVYDELSVSVNPNPATYCSDGAGVNLTATGDGGDGNYTYEWFDQNGNSVGNTNEYLASSQANYTVKVTDGLISATCQGEYLTVPVRIANLPIVNAGPDLTTCASDPTVILNGSVQNADAIWSGGTGTFNPSASSAQTTYTPSPAEISTGFVTLTLSSTNAGGGCSNSSDQVTIQISSLMNIAETIDPIACYGQTATISTVASNGRPGYTYLWTNGATTSDITVPAGNYGLTVTDQFNCTVTENYNITQPTPIVLTLTSDDEVAGNDGAVHLVLNGGDPAYSITWTNGVGTTVATDVYDVTNLPDDVYTATVTDGNGCTVSGSVVVNTFACSNFSITTSATNVLCYADADGIATVTGVLNAIGPVSYAWSTSPTDITNTVSGLTAGVYTVTVTDLGASPNCMEVASIQIQQPVALSNSMLQTNVSVQFGNDGSATAIPAGGTSPYDYLWTPGSAITPTISGLVAGTYSVEVTDFNSCVITDQVYISEPPCNTFLMSVNTTPVDCFGNLNGAASLLLANGTAPYAIVWSSGQTNVTSVSGLSAGSYNVSVTDNEGCFVTENFTISQPDQITLSLAQSNVSCYGAQDGSIDLTVAGGTYPTYTYSWVENGKLFALHQDVTGLNPTTYTITVTDENGCTASASIGITQPSAISAPFTYQNNVCHGESLGSINVSPTGGTLGYTYDWTGPSGFTASTQDLNSLPIGLYELNITDGSNCEFGPVQVAISQPALIVPVATLVQQVSCNNGADGAVNLSVTGGVPAYSYAWTGPLGFTASTQNITGLVAGTYSVTVSDNNGCSVSTSIIVTTVLDIIDPVITCIADQTVSTSSTTCTYTQIGTAWDPIASDECLLSTVEYELTGATTGTGSNSIANVIFNIGVTVVTWTAEDAFGNTAQCSYEITVEDNTAPVITNCGAGNQIVDADLSECSYTHSGSAWDPVVFENCTTTTISAELTGATTQSGVTTLDGIVFNLGTTHVVWTVTDAANNVTICDFDILVEDNQDPAIVACVVDQTIDADAGECTYTVSGTAWDATATDNCTAVTITAAVTGATTATGLTTLNNFVFNLGTSTVTWTITDGSSNSVQCIYDVTVEDNQDPIIASCVADQTIDANTGVCTYTVSGTAWDATATDNCTAVTITAAVTGATTATGLTTLNNFVFNLGTSTVTWTITDGSSNSVQCIYDVTVEDNQDPVIASCVADQTIDANTGVCTYTVSGTAWDATATDNCTAVTITAAVTGATTATGLTTLNNFVFNLGTSTVTWTITDGSSNSVQCIYDVTVEDNQDPIIASCVADQTIDANTGVCTYTVSGTAWDATATDNCTAVTITAAVTGATTATGLTTLNNFVFNLGTSTVTWTITDGSSNSVQCIYDVTVEDNQDPIIASCVADQTIDANTGVCTYTVSGTAWDATATDNCTAVTITAAVTGATTATGLTTLNNFVFNLGTSTVTWTITDGSSNSVQCIYDVTVEDNQDPIINGCLSDITVDSDLGDCGAIVNWTIPTFTDNCGATMAFTHTPGTFFQVGTTTVTYTVTDGSNNQVICDFNVTVEDNEAPQIICAAPIESCDPTVTFAQPTVSDNCGIATINQTTGLVSGSNFPVGTTTVTYEVIDIHTNSSTCSFDVTIFPVPVIGLTATDVTCNGFADGQIDATVTIGTAPYTYSWSNNENSEDLTDLAPGTYTLDLVDDNGCVASASASITQPEILTLEAVVDNVNCYNGVDGSINLTIGGGTLPYTFDWNNDATTEDIADLAIGNYDVTVTDGNQCIVTFATPITQPDTLLITATVYDAICGAPTGTISVEVTGGTEPYDFTWSNGTSGINLYNVVAGTYTLTVTDIQNCVTTFTGTVGTNSDLSGTIIEKGAKCYGENSGELQAVVESGYAPFTYEWSDGQVSPSATELAAGAYSVLITDMFGCQTTLYGEVVEPDSLFIELSTSLYVSGDNVSLYNGNDGYVNAQAYGGTTPYDYSWTGSNGFIANTQNIVNLEAGVYVVTVIDGHGCKATATSRLTQPDVLEMPSGFSPNGDGANDNFVVHGIEAYPVNTIIIYNRWGNIVYEMSNYSNEWNGDNKNGEPLPDATYFVVLTVEAGDDQITLTGYVDLRR